MKQRNNIRIKVPDPLVLALWLSWLTLVLAWLFGTEAGEGLHGIVQLLGWWGKGFWELLAFSMQMVLILLLGYMLALSPALDALSTGLSKTGQKPRRQAVAVVLTALLAGFLNWGLALVFGSVLVRKLAEKAKKEGSAINYPLLGASAYVCMMVWHGGLSGSAPLTVAGQGHFLFDKTGLIGLGDTLFSGMNLLAWLLLFLVIPGLTYLMARGTANRIPEIVLPDREAEMTKEQIFKISLLSVTGLALVVTVLLQQIMQPGGGIGLNEINLLLFGLVLIFLPEPGKLSKAASTAAGSTMGIILQFPLYAGIMGMMKYSGLLVVMTGWFVDLADAESFPMLAFVSAAVVNLFVPSGGGQWAVQGPLLTDAATALGVSHSVTVMALAYGDQLTNMLQPFWALPLLGITGLKAGEILPYALKFMVAGFAIFSIVLWLFG